MTRPPITQHPRHRQHHTKQQSCRILPRALATLRMRALRDPANRIPMDEDDNRVLHAGDGQTNRQSQAMPHTSGTLSMPSQMHVGMQRPGNLAVPHAWLLIPGPGRLKLCRPSRWPPCRVRGAHVRREHRVSFTSSQWRCAIRVWQKPSPSRVIPIRRQQREKPGISKYGRDGTGRIRSGHAAKGANRRVLLPLPLSSAPFHTQHHSRLRSMRAAGHLPHRPWQLALPGSVALHSHQNLQEKVRHSSYKPEIHNSRTSGNNSLVRRADSRCHAAACSRHPRPGGQ